MNKVILLFMFLSIFSFGQNKDLDKFKSQFQELTLNNSSIINDKLKLKASSSRTIEYNNEMVKIRKSLDLNKGNSFINEPYYPIWIKNYPSVFLTSHVNLSQDANGIFNLKQWLTTYNTKGRKIDSLVVGYILIGEDFSCIINLKPLRLNKFEILSKVVQNIYDENGEIKRSKNGNEVLDSLLIKRELFVDSLNGRIHFVNKSENPLYKIDYKLYIDQFNLHKDYLTNCTDCKLLNNIYQDINSDNINDLLSLFDFSNNPILKQKSGYYLRINLGDSHNLFGFGKNSIYAFLGFGKSKFKITKFYYAENQININVNNKYLIKMKPQKNYLYLNTISYLNGSVIKDFLSNPVNVESKNFIKTLEEYLKN